jgi:DsbC/DsbD-like thiol-disulfide interchange protein
MLTEADGFIIHNYPDKVFYFTNMADQDAAQQLVSTHATVDFHLSGVFTPNDNGEGSHTNANTVWYVTTTEDLPAQYFTPAVLSAAGQAELDAILAAREADAAAAAAYIAANPPQH